jgi:coatomer subunit delta
VRKRKAKQLELQRKEAARSGRGIAPRPPSYPVYTPPSRPSVPETFDTYEAEKKKSFAKCVPYRLLSAFSPLLTLINRPLPNRGKGMQLGKKSKTTDIYEKVRSDLGPEIEESTPLASPQAALAAIDNSPSARASLEREPIHITVAETISAKLTRDGTLKSFEVKGDLQLRISDPSFTKVKLDLAAKPTHGAQFRTHPNVDKALFTNSNTIQLKDTSKRFPHNNSIGVLRWRVTSTGSDSSNILPITFTVWVNKGSDSTTVTAEYELTGSDTLRDVTVTIPYGATEPTVTSYDAVYEVSGDCLDWNIGTVDESCPTGSFEFESAGADSDEQEFFPMTVAFSKTSPFVEVDVSSVSLLDMDESVGFSKDVKSAAEGYSIE